MDEIIIAKDIDTDKTLGIESMNVTPSSFLSNYLYGSEKLTGLLSKKALEYNSKQQRYHKRLTRYLSWRWRIQQSYQHLTHSYSIGGPKGLLQVMEISMNRKPSLTRQVFEKTLDDLMRDQVIKEWKYSPEIDEEKCKGKSWFENYWLKLKVIISPTNELVKLQQELITKKSKQQTPLIIEIEEKPSVIEEKPISVLNQETPNSIEFYIEKMNTYKEKNNKSIRELAKEIDISYSTLSRMLSVNYKEKDIIDKIFKEQEGNIINRYKMRKQAENDELKRNYKLTPQLNTTAYESFIKDKYNEILKNPVNAELSIEGTTVNISQSQNGEKIDKGKLTDLTKQAITSGTSDITLPVTLLKPERSTEDIQKMGIKEVIAEYSTPMAGRNGNQSFNVNKSANTLSGVIVAPDETFSFNGRVGVTDAAHGYKSAAVYSQGKVIQSAGGGVCQVSSTLYSAALRADLGIVSRSNHSMPVNYLPLGQDAAVADYGPDLKLKNNTGNHIYIQAFSNGGSITTRIFGTNTGKNVEVSSQVISRTNDKITAVTYKKVTQNGEVISNGQISKSVYKSAPKQ